MATTRSASLFAATAFLGACGLSAVGGVAPGDDAGGPETTDAPPTGDGGGGDGQVADGAIGERDAAVDGDPGDASPPPSNVYVHSPSTLYRVDTAGSAMMRFTFGGDCAGIDVGDIAFDRAGALYATTLPGDGTNSHLHRIDAVTGACGSSLGDLGQRCNGLTFAPDPADASKDVLYVSCAKMLGRIDPSNGQITMIGPFTGGLSASGDLAWLPGVGLFVTLTTAGNDALGQVDATTGKATKIIDDLGAGQLYGLAYRGGSLLAFGDETMLRINPATKVVSLQSSTVAAYGAATGP